MRVAILARMVDSTTDLFLDGVLSDTATPHSAIASQYFPVGFGVFDAAPAAQQVEMGAAIMKLVTNKTLTQVRPISVPHRCAIFASDLLADSMYAAHGGGRADV